MASQLKRREVISWLLRNGFVERPGKGGHLYFAHEPSGVKIAIPGHGSPHLTKRVEANVVRSLEDAGFEREHVRASMRGAA